MPLRVKQPQHWPRFSRHLASLASLPFWGTGLSNDHLGQALGLCDMSVTVLAKRPVFWKDCRPMPLYRETLPPLFHIICCIYLFRFIQGLHAGPGCTPPEQSSTVAPSPSQEPPGLRKGSRGPRRHAAPLPGIMWPYLTISDHLEGCGSINPNIANIGTSFQAGQEKWQLLNTCWTITTQNPQNHWSWESSYICLYHFVSTCSYDSRLLCTSELFRNLELQTSSNNQIQRVVDQLLREFHVVAIPAARGMMAGRHWAVLMHCAC